MTNSYVGKSIMILLNHFPRSIDGCLAKVAKSKVFLVEINLTTQSQKKRTLFNIKINLQVQETEIKINSPAILTV